MIDAVLTSWAANQKLFMSPYSFSSFDGSGSFKICFFFNIPWKIGKLYTFLKTLCVIVYVEHEIIYKYLSSLFLSLDYCFFQICLHRLLSFSCASFSWNVYLSCFSCHFKVNKKSVAFWNLHICFTLKKKSLHLCYLSFYSISILSLITITFSDIFLFIPPKWSKVAQTYTVNY